MEAIILALIQELNASVFTLIAILIVSFWVAYQGGGIVISYKDFKKKNEKIDSKIDSIKDSLAKISATTDLLYQAHLSTVQTHSPIDLSPKGEEISKAIAAEEKVNNHWEAIRAELEKRKPTNPYDIQSVAMDISGDCFDKIFTAEEQNQIKNHAFSIGINLLEIYPIIGVIIRNRILEERNMKIEDVDSHDSVGNKANS